MNTTIVLLCLTRSPNLTLSPSSSITSSRLASNSALTSGRVSTSKAAASATFLAFFSFRDSLGFLAASSASANLMSSRRDHDPQVEAEPAEHDKGDECGAKDGARELRLELGVRRDMVDAVSALDGRRVEQEDDALRNDEEAIAWFAPSSAEGASTDRTKCAGGRVSIGLSMLATETGAQTGLGRGLDMLERERSTSDSVSSGGSFRLSLRDC